MPENEIPESPEVAEYPMGGWLVEIDEDTQSIQLFSLVDGLGHPCVYVMTPSLALQLAERLADAARLIHAPLPDSTSLN